ncbi:hypothetical protein A1O1_09034 [Capronia coronata CBS 617.96]|uniref:Uncharacterized protein n=1 Tax=Capronia coronata CBS 617.96 TaxID=1182541 RepID=W9XEI5_9EURO|nr:uncharacterized protein A1O1_09034 [Capronia coronata CBS 617.96]EXJ78633.1 hypothetical protein A1O1_09034 [Capronia coronata CBS 617.96]
MPHKHKRKREDDESNFDLPPSIRAKPLTTLTKQESIFTSDKEKKEKKQQKRKQKSKNNGYDDDTPKSFARLMAYQQGKRPKNAGLDDGNYTKKKKAKVKASQPDGDGDGDTKTKVPGSAAASASIPTPTPSTTTPSNDLKILPGERLSEFAARVNQSLPLSSIPKQTTRVAKIPGLENLKTPLTKHNKRLARLQSEWRATEARLRAKLEDESEELADQREEDEIVWLGAGIDKNAGSKKKKKGKKGKYGNDDDDVDPWKQLERKRSEEGELGRQRNLQDVVQAPPVLKGVKNIFKDKGDKELPQPLRRTRI